MILFFYGPDSYRSQRKLDEVVEHYKKIHKTGVNLHLLSTDNADFSTFKAATGVVSMFGEKKLVVLKGFLASRDFLEKFISWSGLDSLKNTTDIICVFYEGEVDKKNKLTTWLIKNCKTQEFNILRGVQLQKWAQRFVQERGIKVEKTALLRLIAHTAGDLWAFENEINKLKAYSRDVSNADLDIFLRPASQTHIFSLVDAFIEGNAARAVRLLREHLDAGDNENYIFYMVYNQFRNVAEAQSGSLGGMHPFVARKSSLQARRFSKDEIKKTFNRLMNLDMDIKTGRMEPRSALVSLILES